MPLVETQAAATYFELALQQLTYGGRTDYLMKGTTVDLAAENINDKTLINQFNRISELSEENKTVVSKLIDAFLFQQEMKVKLGQ